MEVAEDPPSFGRIQPFSEGSQHHGDLLGGGFQTVQRGMPPGSERGTEGLAAHCLDELGLAMLAIARESMDVGVCDAEVRALVVRPGEALCVPPLRCPSAAFDLEPAPHLCPPGSR